MAGGGIVRSDALSICKRGVQNIMSHLGIVPENHQASTVAEEKILKLPGAKGFVFAPMEGVFEPFHELGQQVSAVQEAGLVHSMVNPFEPPKVMCYETLKQKLMLRVGVRTQFFVFLQRVEQGRFGVSSGVAYPRKISSLIPRFKKLILRNKSSLVEMGNNSSTEG